MGKTEEWIDRVEAAHMLKCSVRTLERHAERGRIRRQFQAPTGEGAHVLFNRADVLAVRAGKPNTYAVALANQTAPRQIAAPDAEPPRGEMDGSPWISLDRAAELHLFPLPFLRQAAEDGIIDAVQVLDSAKSQRWLIHRDCLMDAGLAIRWRACCKRKRERERGAGA